MSGTSLPGRGVNDNKDSPPFFFSRERGMRSRVRLFWAPVFMRPHGFAFLRYADQKPKYNGRARELLSGCPASKTPSFEESLALESRWEAEPTPSLREVYVLDAYLPSLSCSEVWHLTQA